MKIIERIHDLSNNEVTEVERDMNSEELAQHEADLAKAEAIATAEAEKAAAKSALLAKLGISEEEAKLLLS